MTKGGIIKKIRIEKIWEWGSAFSAFLLSLVSYWLTVAPTASFWDCPEYIATAFGLEVGHPPGNPLWMLTARIVTLIAPAGKAALWINLSSGFFTAVAIMLSCSVSFCFVNIILRSKSNSLSDKSRCMIAAAAALTGSLALGWCDSVWFSAVEAEVYAMSLMFTALSVWLIVKWAIIPQSDASQKAKALRYLVVSAYVLGLSIGVHQLNLLVLPALALVIAYRNNKDTDAAKSAWMSIALGCVLIILLLKGMLPGTAMVAADFELLCVNKLQLPFDSGVITYLILTIISIVAAVTSVSIEKSGSLYDFLSAVSISALLFCSAVFMIAENLLSAIILSALIGFGSIYFKRIPKSAVRIAVYMLSATVTGFSVYIIIPIRAHANPPINESQPGDAFSYLSYVNREQYGSKPLLTGPTPYSRSVVEERFSDDSVPDYRYYHLKQLNPVYFKNVEGMRIVNTSRMLGREDSIKFKEIQKRNKDAYQLVDYRYQLVDVPELNMFLSRLQGRKPDDIESYKAWAGMDSASMRQIEISEAIDSAGNFVGKIGADGKRHRPLAYKPTQWHNLRFMLGYQVGYMYLRYLLWNFSGRQNDIPSTGEIDHGNFITGFSVIDNSMLGSQDKLPPAAGKENHGRNVYFMLPLLLGIIGAVWGAFAGRKTQRIDTVILMLFLLTGVAIVLYLNQNTGEARERDYSFLGSYMAFTMWMSLGVSAVSLFAIRLTKKFKNSIPSAFGIGAAVACLAIPAWMLAENIDDHNRSQRTAAEDYAVNILESLEPNAILFTDGDNLTFPLWYAQEVLGVRQDVRLISCTYLVQPGYIPQLMTPIRKDPALAFTAQKKDVISGRFGSTPFPQDTAMTAVDAIEALKMLYSSDAPHPSVTSANLSLTGINPGLFSISLRKAASGATTIKRRQLMTLDIIASNYASKNPRPIYFINTLNNSYLCGMGEVALHSLFARRLPDASMMDKPEMQQHKLDSMAVAQLANLKFGGFEFEKGPYTDFTVHRETSYQRASILALAKRLLERGDKKTAFKVAAFALEKMPPERSPLRVTSFNNGAFDEAIEAARILAAAAADDNQKQQAVKLLRHQADLGAQWNRYLNSLGSRKKAASRFSRALAAKHDCLKAMADSIQLTMNHPCIKK